MYDILKLFYVRFVLGDKAHVEWLNIPLYMSVEWASEICAYVFHYCTIFVKIIQRNWFTEKLKMF